MTFNAGKHFIFRDEYHHLPSWSRFSEKVKIVPQSTGMLLLKASVDTELLAYL